MSGATKGRAMLREFSKRLVAIEPFKPTWSYRGREQWCYVAATPLRPPHVDVKIGHSANPSERMRTLRTHNAVPITQHFLMRGGAQLERTLHTECYQWRAEAQNEWYRFSYPDEWRVFSRALKVRSHTQTTTNTTDAADRVKRELKRALEITDE